MNISIFFDFIEGPWGGGNQFLKNLKKNLVKKKKYENNIFKTKAILINSHHKKYKLLFLKFFYKKKILVHRIDGPLDYRSKEKNFQNENIKIINKYFADATIFQSTWSKLENDIKFTKFSDVIWNAPDPKLFFYKKNNKKSKKIKLISTCWSTNLNKGHKWYKYLDETLDFSKYEMCFIGRSNFIFKNIKVYPPLNSHDISKHLQKSDIFIFCSKTEACSNSLLEALHTQLPIVYAEGSSNNEIVKQNGISFKNHDIIEKINIISKKLDKYEFNFNNIYPDIEDVTNKYLLMFQKVKSSVSKKIYVPKKINLLTFLIILFNFILNDLKDKYK
tara:strand:+ start:47 stop:1042 length:996 start_codon:yes stop_codon:yes gene_type:complete